MGEKQKNKGGKRRPMTKEMLSEWLNRMGYKPREAAYELGCTVAELRAWTSGAIKIPRYIGLACSALGMDMHAYGEDWN